MGWVYDDVACFRERDEVLLLHAEMAVADLKAFKQLHRVHTTTIRPSMCLQSSFDLTQAQAYIMLNQHYTRDCKDRYILHVQSCTSKIYGVNQASVHRVCTTRPCLPSQKAWVRGCSRSRVSTPLVSGPTSHNYIITIQQSIKTNIGRAGICIHAEYHACIWIAPQCAPPTSVTALTQQGSTLIV